MTGKQKLIQYATKILKTSMLVLLCSLPLTSLARAEDEALDKRLDQLERQLNAVQRKVFGGGSGSAPQAPAQAAPSQPNASMADIEVRMTDLETQISQTTGAVEQANNKIDQLTRKLDTFMKDAEFRFTALEGKGHPAGAAAGGEAPLEAPVAASDKGMEKPANALPAATPAALYNHAYALLSAGKYSESEQAFAKFLKQYPGDELAANAQYWLAQTYFVRGDYATAAKSFLTGYQKYPASPKAPAYLLKVGITLTKLGQNQDACDVFRELATKFPLSPESKTRRPAEMKVAGCKK